MSERETRFFASWTERERGSDLAWISENLYVFWLVAQQGYEEHGRGAVVVDTANGQQERGTLLVISPGRY